MRPPGFAQIVEDKPWLSRPAHKGRWASIRSKGVPKGQRALLDGALAGRYRDQVAGRKEWQLGARLRVCGVKLADHQEVVCR